MSARENLHPLDPRPGHRTDTLKGVARGPIALHPRAIGFAGWAGLSIASIAFLSFGLGEYGIINGNESLYIEAAREMLQSRQYAIPTLDGLPYLEKPPLFVWLVALASGFLGTSGLSARLVTGIAAVALVLATARYSALLGIGKIGVAAGYVLMTTLGVYVMARVAMPDLLLTALFTTACFSCLTALRTRRLGHMRLSAALLGAASLVKGPLPITLFALVTATFLCVQRNRRGEFLALLRDPWSALLLVAPLTSWLLAIEISQPGAASHFIVNENLLRFLGVREPHDYYHGSIFYYVPRLFLFFFPWAGVLAFGWLAVSRDRDPRKKEVRLFLWLCVWIPFVFFTLSSAKANYYVLICVPPGALLAADYLREMVHRRHRFSLAMAIAVPVLVFVALWSFRIWAVVTGRTPPLLDGRGGPGFLIIAVILVLTVIALAILQAGWRRGAMLCLGGLILPLSLEVNHLLLRGEPLMSARPMAAYIRDRFPEAPVLLYQDFEAYGGLPIYLGRTTPVIDSRSSDLYFGRLTVPAHRSFMTEEQALAAGPGALIVVMNDRERAFSSTRLRSRAVHEITIGHASLYRIRAPD